MTTEVKTQLAEHPLANPKAEPEPEKKPEHFPRSHGNVGFQKEPVVPGIVDFELIQEERKTSKPQTPSAYRFGRLSHHSFFSRHHPQPQHVTHMPDVTGKPICVVRDEFSLTSLTPSALLSSCVMGMPTTSVPIGDPQSNRNPQLSPSVLMTQGGQIGPQRSRPVLSDTWKKNLKDLASRMTVFTKEIEPRINELLELLCQILQTDSLRAIQFWLLYAPPKEKDLALGLLQTAVAQLMPQPLPSLPAEKLLSQLQELQEPQEKQQATYSPSLKKTKTPSQSKTEKPEFIGKAQVLRLHPSKDSEGKTTKTKAKS